MARCTKVKEYAREHRVFFLLLFYGIVIGVFLTRDHWFTIGNGWIAEWRSDRLTHRYEDLLEFGKFDIAYNSHTLGYGLYFPYLMKCLSIESGERIYCLVQAFMGMVVLSTYPLLMWMMFRSLLIAFLSPLMIHMIIGDMLYINKAGEYFSPLWAFVMGIPLLIMMFRKVNVYLTSGLILVIAMLSNVMRSHSALPLIMIWFIVLAASIFKKDVSVMSGILLCVLALSSYDLLGTTIPQMVADRWGVEGRIPYNSSPWHSILIGMGYIENDYGLYYDDNAAKNLILEKYPGVEYISPEYYDRCKEMALEIIKDDPIFVLNGIVVKFNETMELSFNCWIGRTHVTERKRGIFLCGLIGAILIYTLANSNNWMKVFKEFGEEFLIQCAFVLGMVLLGSYTAVIACPTVYYDWGGQA